jgi:vancomycin permeability regulator SanA
MGFAASSSVSRPSDSPTGRGSALRPLDLAASAVARGWGLFIALFTLLNLLLQWLTPGFDPNQWWINFRPLWNWVATAFLLGAATVLLGYAFFPKMSPLRRRITLSFCELMGLLALWNAAHYFWLLGQHSIYHGSWFPFSLLVAIALVVVWRGVAARQQAVGGSALLAMAVAFVCAVVAFPLGQMACFGTTDYRRQADAIVVLGAGVDARGNPSNALRDRVDLAVELYHEQLDRKQPPPLIIFSGAQGGDEGANEATVMFNLARKAGIPGHDLDVDLAGSNTAFTIEHTAAKFNRLARDLDLVNKKRALRVLVVSHFFHLPRIKMAYQRQEAMTLPQVHWQIFTVPVPQPLQREPYFILREVAAQWTYYCRSLFSQD